MKMNILRVLCLLGQTGNFGFGGEPGGGEPSGGEPSGGEPSGGEPSGGEPGGGEPPKTKYKYPESLPEEYHENPSLLKFANSEGEFDYGNLAKSYIHLQSNVGKDKIVKPNADFTEEQWKETYKAMGLPEDLNDYKIENNLPEGVKGNDDFVNAFKQTAHEAGVLPKQAQKLMDFYNEQVVAKMTEGQENSQAYLDSQKEILTKEWGDAFDKKMGRADEAVKELLSESEVKEVQDMGLFQNATFAKLMAKIADGMMDDKFSDDVKGTMGMTPHEIDSAIQTLWHSDEYQSKTHPNHANAMKKYNDLMAKKVKYGSK